MREFSLGLGLHHWGGDEVYTEPYTTTPEYQSFSSVFRGSEVLQCPSPELDAGIFSVCRKVYVMVSF